MHEQMFDQLKAAWNLYEAREALACPIVCVMAHSALLRGVVR